VAGSHHAAGGAFRLDDARRFSPVWFVLAVSYPALALTKVRSFSNIARRTIRWRAPSLTRPGCSGGYCF
jgi:hypothetical protein